MAIKVWKHIHNRVKLYLSGQPDLSYPTFLWIKTHKRTGLPSKLVYLNGLISSRNSKHALQITAAIYGVTVQPDIDISSVEEVSTFDRTKTSDYLTEFIKFIRKSLHLVKLREVRPYTSMKAGPNASIALIGSISDIIAIKLSYHEDYLLSKILEYTSSKRFRKVFDDFTNIYWGKLLGSPTVINAKLAFISSNGAKTRVVYIINYWLQCALKPIADLIFEWLKNQPQDGTFEQGYAIETVRKWTEEGKPLWSFDLTAATDRWPVYHQSLVLSAFIGDKVGYLWMILMKIKPFVKELNRYANYAVGQPIGANSSWAAFAITHHLTIRHLCERSGVNPDCYVVLGDDVVIANETVANEYVKTLDLLGVKISKAKSITPTKGSVSAAEFARRTFVAGHDLSPISVNLLKEFIDSRQWWKIFEISQEVLLKERWYIQHTNEQAGIPSPVIKLILLNQRNIDSITVLVCNRWIGNASVHKMDTTLTPDITAEHTFVPDPWSGIDDMSYKIAFYGEVATRLKNTISEVNEIVNQLSDVLNWGADGKTAKPLTLTNSPLVRELTFIMSDSLDEWVDAMSVTKDKFIVRSLIESEFLKEVLTGNKDLKTYLRKKDRLLIQSPSWLVTLNKSLKGEQVPNGAHEVVNPDPVYTYVERYVPPVEIVTPVSQEDVLWAYDVPKTTSDTPVRDDDEDWVGV